MDLCNFRSKYYIILYILFQVVKSRSSRKQLETHPLFAEERRRVTHKEEVGGGKYLAGKNIFSGTGLLTKESK